MKKSLTFRVLSGAVVAAALLLPTATATAAIRELTRPATGATGTTAGRVEAPVPVAANLPFRLSVPGAAASGVYTSSQGKPGTPQVTVTLKVTGRAPCGVLQLTRNGPTDAIEWYTAGALCNSGTATFRTQVNRLWGSRSLPSIRLCNGDSLGLAEGVDCDDFAPPRGV